MKIINSEYYLIEADGLVQFDCTLGHGAEISEALFLSKWTTEARKQQKQGKATTKHLVI